MCSKCWSDFVVVILMYATATIIGYCLAGTVILPFAAIAFLYIFDTLAYTIKAHKKGMV